MPKGNSTCMETIQLRRETICLLLKRLSIKSLPYDLAETLTWNGDPYSAQMDIDAIYPVSADIKDILQSSQSQRVPVNVLMHLDGELMSPEIALSIELPSVNSSLGSDLTSYLRTIQYDEQELNKTGL